MIHINQLRARKSIVMEGGAQYLLYADENGVWESRLQNLEYLSEPRPLLHPSVDVHSVAGWDAPRFSYNTLMVVCESAHDGRRGIRLFSADREEQLPGHAKYLPYSGILTPPDWDCTDGCLLGRDLIFTRRAKNSCSIYTVPLSSSCRECAGRPKRIVAGGEAPVLWYTYGYQPGVSMLYFRRGKACVAIADSWTPEGPWKTLDMPYPISGCYASLFISLDGSFMAAIGTPEGNMQFCYIEGRGESLVLFPQ